MENKILVFLENDRIVEINGFELYVHDNFMINRRNIICYSNKLKNYIRENNLNIDNIQDHILISDKLYMFDDIQIVKVKGFY